MGVKDEDARRAGRGMPAGVVTFLFTDIEGSTRLMVDLDDRYHDVLQAHHTALRAEWDRHGGWEVRTEGDAFFVAFADAADAVQATADAQRALAEIPWPTDGPVRVRMGLHTGYAQPRDGDYIALAVNRAARVADAAHGGQVLVSPDTVQAAGTYVAPLVQDLGRFRVRDFDGPITLHRVIADGWVSDDRPPRVRPAEGHNIPAPLTQLIGRELDQGQVIDRLGTGTLVTLAGPGGVGKTRLATEIGRQLCTTWPDGVWWADLAPVSVEAVAKAVADALGAEQEPGAPVEEDIRRHLESRSLMLILDNCEHVSAAVAALVDDIMRAQHDVAILATSRRPLGLQYEVTHRLRPLPVEGDDAAAIRLFLDRAPAPDPTDRAAIRELCERLEGLPLAIELAAARTELLGVQEVLDQLGSSTRVLRSPDPSRPARHRSLDDVIGWSVDLLDGTSRRGLRRLAVLPGGFDLELATVACTDDELVQDAVPELVWTLVDRSLAAREEASGASRFRLPVPVRLAVASQLTREDRERTVARVGRHFRGVVGPERSTLLGWGSRIGAELDNLLHTVTELAAVDEELAQTLAWSVSRYYDTVSAYATGVALARRHLDVLPAETPARVGLLTVLANLLLVVGQPDAAEILLDEADELASRVGPPVWDNTAVAHGRSAACARRGQFVDAARFAREAIDEASDAFSLARGWNALGVALFGIGRDIDALAALEHSVHAAEQAGFDKLRMGTLSNLAEGYARLERREEAARHQLAALQLARAIGKPSQVAFALMVAGRLALGDRDVHHAAVLHGAGVGILERVGFQLYEADADLAGQVTASLREHLGDDAYTAASQQGAALDLDQAATIAESALRELAQRSGLSRASRATARD